MTSPSVAAAAGRPLNPDKPGRFTLQLSDRLTNKQGSSAEFNSVKFNHKPTQTSSTRTAAITRDNEHYSLTLSDKEPSEKYTYQGQRTSPKRKFVLLFDQSKQACALEPLTSSYTFNLRSAPGEFSAQKLEQTYPQIQASDGKPGGGESFENGAGISGDSDGEPDPSNPYDYRHFLHQNASQNHDRLDSASPEFRDTSGTNTPRSDTGRLTPQTTTSLRKAASKAASQSQPPKQRLAISKPKSQPKPASPPPAKPKPLQLPGKPSNPPPKVRLDRRASTRPGDPKPSKPPSKSTGRPTAKSQPKSAEYINSSEDESPPLTTSPKATLPPPGSSSNALEVDFGNSPPRRGLGGLEVDYGDSPHRGNRHINFNISNDTEGPISLRSAANSASPSSRLHTPLVRPQRFKEDEDEVIDFGSFGGADEDAEGSEDDGYLEEDAEGSLDLDNDGEFDEDVEPMDIGPPEHEPEPSRSAKPHRVEQREEETQATEEVDDDGDFDADFEAEMMQGLASQEEADYVDDGVDGYVGGQESESEEE